MVSELVYTHKTHDTCDIVNKYVVPYYNLVRNVCSDIYGAPIEIAVNDVVRCLVHIKPSVMKSHGLMPHASSGIRRCSRELFLIFAERFLKCLAHNPDNDDTRFVERTLSCCITSVLHVLMSIIACHKYPGITFLPNTSPMLWAQQR